MSLFCFHMVGVLKDHWGYEKQKPGKVTGLLY